MLPSRLLTLLAIERCFDWNLSGYGTRAWTVSNNSIITCIIFLEMVVPHFRHNTNILSAIIVSICDRDDDKTRSFVVSVEI